MSGDRSVRLMITCLVDAFYGEVGIATARVLEAAGYAVDFPEDQTCCGQPPFNSGDWEAARRIGRHCAAVFGADHGAVVTPSASCAAMTRDGYAMLGHPEWPRAWELAEFLIDVAGIRRWPPEGSSRSAERRMAFHQACHGRAIHLEDKPVRLLAMVPGIEIVPIADPEQCCGFGGAFSVTHPMISARIGLEKLRAVQESGVEELVSGDMGCLMHLRGLIDRHALPLRTLHYAQILAEALDG